MAVEIEKKFLLKNNNWRKLVAQSVRYKQGYFSTNKKSSIRIRVTDNSASLNIKSATLGITRNEYDYPIPLDEAEEMLEQLCNRPLLEKTRHFLMHDGNKWEIDEFLGDNQGLIVAELELEHPEQTFSKPDWLGEEVSDDPRYYNVCLVTHPYKDWGQNS